MVELMALLALRLLGYGAGRYNERRHFASIFERERRLRHLLAFSSRHAPADRTAVESMLVAGNVVLSVDYFKRLAAALRNLFGGRVTVYESLLERARREAILRMKEDAERRGATMIFNVKLETASISKGGRDELGAVEVYAYGTALVPRG